MIEKEQISDSHPDCEGWNERRLNDHIIELY